MSLKLEHGLFRLKLTDHHALLGVSLTANGVQIRKSYIKMAQRLHPDKCKDKSKEEQELANELLSKLVNPAYEVLSKDKSRNEHLIVLSQTGKRLASESSKITIASDVAQQLYQAGANLDQVYEQLLTSLAKDQYLSVQQSLVTVAHLSELNLVYLMLKQGQGIRGGVQETIATPVNKESTSTPEKTTTPPGGTQSTTPPASPAADRKSVV